MADGLECGTGPALFGGNATVLPFCLQQKGQTRREALTADHAVCTCVTDVSFYLIATARTAGVASTPNPDWGKET